MLDVVRAARKLDKRLGSSVIIAGHSQGGQAALFAASLAPQVDAGAEGARHRRARAGRRTSPSSCRAAADASRSPAGSAGSPR